MAVNRIDFEAAVERKCETFAKTTLAHYAQKMQQYAKEEENATWKDRTGDARDGLRGDVFYHPGVDMGITLAHTVEYGVYLETANNAKYAVLKPTVEHFMPDVKADLLREFGG
jgi:hypothetical protein